MITIIGYRPGEDTACEFLSGSMDTMSARMDEDLVYFRSDEPVFHLDDAPAKSSFISAAHPPFIPESEA